MCGVRPFSFASGRTRPPPRVSRPWRNRGCASLYDAPNNSIHLSIVASWTSDLVSESAHRSIRSFDAARVSAAKDNGHRKTEMLSNDHADFEINRFKQALCRGKPLLGTWAMLNSTNVV